MNCMKGVCCMLLLFLFFLIVFFGCKEKDMFMKMNEFYNIKGVISYKCSFGDLNDIYFSVVKKIGICLLVFCLEVEGLGGKLV